MSEETNNSDEPPRAGEGTPPAGGDRLESALRDQVEREVETAFAQAEATGGSPAASDGAPAGDAEVASDEEARRILMEEMSSLSKAKPEGAAQPAEASVKADEAAPQPTAEEIQAASADAQAEAPVVDAQAAAAPPTQDAPAVAEPATAAAKPPSAAAPAAEEPVSARERNALREERDAEESAQEPAKARRRIIPEAVVRVPLRVAGFALGLLDKPFTAVGPDARDLVGKIAVAVVLMAVVIFVASLFI